MLTNLTRNWWMMAMRGVLATAFSLCILAWRDPTLGTVMLLFSVYAVLDGGLAIASAIRVWSPRWEAWPVALEGVMSLAVGLLGVAWPFVPREFVAWIAVWGVVTGILEITAAAPLPRWETARWLLGTGGASSLFLGLLLLLLPHAGLEMVAWLIAFSALVAGLAVTLAASRFRPGSMSDARHRLHA